MCSLQMSCTLVLQVGTALQRFLIHALVGQDGGQADAAVVVDGDVQVLIAGPASLPCAVAVDTVAGPTIRAKRLISKWIGLPGRLCS